MKQLLSSLVLIIATPFAAAQSDLLRTNPQFLQSFRDVIRTPAASVVRVYSDNNHNCLGVVVGSDGWILTKAHDLNGKIPCRSRDGKSYEANLVGVHDEHDLAMLKVNAAGLKPIVWTSSENTRAGSWVASVGMF